MKDIATAQQNVQTQQPQPTASAVREEAFKLSEFVDGEEYSAAKVELIRRTVAKGCDNLELAYFISIAKGVGLNPLVKEIWCYKDNKGNLIIFAGRNGFHRILQRCPDFVSMNSCEVREGDPFKKGTKNGEEYVEHEFGTLSEASKDPKVKTPIDRFKKRILGAYCIITTKRNGVLSRIVEWSDFARYNKSWNVWGTHPEEMIKKVSEVHAAKKVTNISGIYAEEEFKITEDPNTGIKTVETGIIEAGKNRKDMLRQLKAQKKINQSKKKK